MAYMKWDERFETSIPVVDAAHRSLVETLNRLHDAMKQRKAGAEVQKILGFLADYAVEHFAAEEALMKRHGYPGHPSHKKIHAALMKEVMARIEAFNRGQVVLSLDLMDFLEAWLSRHILQEDQAYVKYFRDKGISV
jgi:hemerythrin-like metal-binding protein